MNGHRIVLAVPLAAAVVALGVTSVDAKTFPHIPPHQHFVQLSEDMKVEVGPRVCDDASLQHAFDRFHTNVHVGAPGLFAFKHEHNGIEITIVRPCPE